jgi:hypothetical protein
MSIHKNSHDLSQHVLILYGQITSGCPNLRQPLGSQFMSPKGTDDHQITMLHPVTARIEVAASAASAMAA